MSTIFSDPHRWAEKAVGTKLRLGFLIGAHVFATMIFCPRAWLFSFALPAMYLYALKRIITDPKRSEPDMRSRQKDE